MAAVEYPAPVIVPEPAAIIEPDPRFWYAVRTRSHFEAKVEARLKEQRLDAFLPRMAVRSRRTDRKKTLLKPIFPGYLFAHVEPLPDQFLAVVKTVGVVHLLSVLGRPHPVRPEEIRNLMILDGTDHPLETCAHLNVGDRVRILNGSLAGLVGLFVRRKGKAGQVVVSVDFLMRSVAVEIADWQLEKVA